MNEPLPYGRQIIEQDDIDAVVEALKSGWLTTGPKVGQFEEAFAGFCGAGHAVALANGTAALHAAMFALGIGPGDEVVVPAMTFAASANCAVYAGARPVFADVDPGTLLIDPADVERKITPRTRAVVAVDYAGLPCDYDRLRALCAARGLKLVADACHAVGGSYRGRPVGSLADISAFSFHPVKNMTTGEGGAATTDDPGLAARMRRFRSHGITADFRERMQSGSWFYEMTDLGFNCRLTDFQCALGLSQLRKLPGWVRRRNEIARRYTESLAGVVMAVHPAVGAGHEVPGCGNGGKATASAGSRPRPSASPPAYPFVHAYHLFMIRVPAPQRAEIFTALRAAGIGVNVHYIPVHLHPFYRTRFGAGPGQCPVAESSYEELITLPLFPGMRDADTDRVIDAVRAAMDSIR